MEQESLLTGIEFFPALARSGQRFLNFLIDGVLISFCHAFFLGGTLLAGTALSVSETSSFYQAGVEVISFFFYAIIYFLMELVFKGRTIGKLITGTKAVNEDGTEMVPKTILIRSLIRMIPFEALSAFNLRPWHDKWSKTFVIDVKKTSLVIPLNS